MKSLNHMKSLNLTKRILTLTLLTTLTLALGATVVFGDHEIQALEFDGHIDFVRITLTDTAQIIGTRTSFTISAWVKVDQFDSNLPTVQHPIYGEYDPGDDDVRNGISITNDGRVFFNQFPGGTGVNGLFSNSNRKLTARRYHHIAYTQDDTLMGRFYIDGVLDNEDGPMEAYVGSAPIKIAYIGWRADPIRRDFDGRIAEVALWDRALSPVEIVVSSQSVDAIGPAGLLAHWNFNEGSGTTAQDASGNGHSGLLQGGTQWVSDELPLLPPILVSPATKSNNRVNVARGKSFTAFVEPHPHSAQSVQYQWQVVPYSASGQPGPARTDAWGTARFSNSRQVDDGDYATGINDYTVYVRTKEGTHFSVPLAIPITVWDPPIVEATPPTPFDPNDPSKASWYTDHYAGVVEQPVKLEAIQAASDPTQYPIGADVGVFLGTDVFLIDPPIDISDAWTIVAQFQYPLPAAAFNTLTRGTNDHQILVKSGVELGTWDNATGTRCCFLDSGYQLTGLSNGWHHIAAVGSGTSTTYYIDGIQVGVSNFKSTSDVLAIGNLPAGGQPFGTVDDFAIFNRDLSPDEIERIRNNSPLIPELENDLRYYNNFDTEGITKYIWLDDQGNPLVVQTPGSVAEHTFSRQNLQGSIKAKAVTNYDIEGPEQSFNLTMYPQLEVNAGGPYTGRAKKPTRLEGSVNTEGYPGATFAYQWFVENTPGAGVDTSTPDPELSASAVDYTWTPEGTYNVQLKVTVTTEEGLELTGSGSATAIVEAGVPTALPGGPYRGGMKGGNFSPVQLLGNHPDFVEAEDIGVISNWQWIFKTSADPDATATLLDENVENVIRDLGGDALNLKKIAGSHSGEALQVDAPDQRSNSNVPGWAFKIMETPQAPDEFRYLIFAWRKEGGTGITLELHGDVGGADHRYHAGANVNNLTPSIQVSETIPDQWEIVTADLFTDWGAFTLTGISFAPLDGIAGFWDSISLHKTQPGRPGFPNEDQWNPTQAYPKPGRYDVSLRVLAESGKWSPVATTTVEVIKGIIKGAVKAADKRTPVAGVRLTLASSHVDPNALTRLASTSEDITTTESGEIYTETDAEGNYSFEPLPLGEYRITASKKVEGEDPHEFEQKVIATELTLNAPTQLAVDFVDISVFPVGGRIVYSIQKNGNDVFVDGIIVKALPIGTTSFIESLASTKSPSATGTNYTVPLFAGVYLIKVDLGGHDIRLVGTNPNDPARTPPPGYDIGSQLVTIKNARTDIDFIDYTTQDVTVFVEDFAEFPVDTYQGNKVRVQINGDNGFAEGDVTLTQNKAFFKATLPPGKYTVSLPNVPTAFVKGDTSKKQAEVDLRAPEPQTVTMVVPVPIDLQITPTPRLLNVSDEFLENIGLTAADNPEGFMVYFPPEIQAHTYTVTATANGNPVVDFTLKVRDDISQLTFDPAPEITYPNSGDDRYQTDANGAGLYTIQAGLPNRTVVDESDPNTYLDYTLEDGVTVVKVPKVLPKTITFSASKDGYEPSILYTENVTVLGDMTVGSASELVSIPNINYLVLHDPPGDASSSYIDDSMTIKGIILGLTIKANNISIPVYPSPWSEERGIN